MTLGLLKNAEIVHCGRGRNYVSITSPFGSSGMVRPLFMLYHLTDLLPVRWWRWLLYQSGLFTKFCALTVPIPVAKSQPVVAPYAFEYELPEVESTPFLPEGR